MPDFAAAHNAAFKDLTAQDYAAADAAAESEHDNVGVVLAGACNRFAQGRAVRVIRYADRAGDNTPEFLYQIHIPPAQVIGIDHFSFAPVDGSGNACSNADTLIQRDFLLLQKIQCRLRHFVDKLRSILHHIRGECAHRDDLLVVVYQSDLRLGAANDDARTDRACFLADRG